MKIKNLTFNEYYVLEDKTEMNFAIKYGKELNEPLDVFDIGDFTELPFKIVKDMQYYITEGITWENIFEVVHEVKKIDHEHLGMMTIYSLARFKSYVDSEIQRINKIEGIALSHTPTNEEEIAGIEDLSDLGTYLQFRELANEDITKIKEIGQMKYSDCLLELVARKRIYEYRKELVKRKSKK
jgi:hypothetical protein